MKTSASNSLPLFPSLPEPAPSSAARQAALATMQSHSGLLTRGWRWVQSRREATARSKRLHVAETISLGEKRFVALVQVDNARFLIGGSSGSVTLLTQLEAEESFNNVLKKTRTPRRASAAKTKAATAARKKAAA